MRRFIVRILRTRFVRWFRNQVFEAAEYLPLLLVIWRWWLAQTHPEDFQFRARGLIDHPGIMFRREMPVKIQHLSNDLSS